jgi:hypothetical protein
MNRLRFEIDNWQANVKLSFVALTGRIEMDVEMVGAFGVAIVIGLVGWRIMLWLVIRQ